MVSGELLLERSLVKGEYVVCRGYLGNMRDRREGVSFGLGLDGLKGGLRKY